MSEEIIGKLAWLTQIHQQHFSFAVFEPWSKETIDRFGSSLRHEPHVIGGIRKLDQSAIRIFRFLGIEHPGADAHADLLAE